MLFSYVDVLFSKHITLLFRSSMILFFACVANIKDSGQDPIDTSIIDKTRSLSKVANWITDSKGYATGFATTDINQDGFVDVVLSYGNDMDKGPISMAPTNELLKRRTRVVCPLVILRVCPGMPPLLAELPAFLANHRDFLLVAVPPRVFARLLATPIIGMLMVVSERNS